MQIPLSKEATQAGPWYLKSLPRTAGLLGDALYRANAARDFEWIDPDDAFLATVLDREGEHEVDMHFDSRQWHGECTCRKLRECEHCYAALAALLAANRRVLLRGPDLPFQAETKSPAAEAELGFLAELEQKLARPLDRGEGRAARAIVELWQKHPEGMAPEKELYFILGGKSNWSWERHTLWPAPPKSAWDAWLYLAEFLQRKKKPAPAFLAQITPAEEVEAIIAPWRRQEVVQQWTGWLHQRTAHTPGPAAAAPLDLRVLFLREGMQVEHYVAAEGLWKPMKKGRWTELNRTNAGREVPMNDESLLIWTTLHTGWGDDPLTRYASQHATLMARKLLTSSLLRTRVLTAAGEPFQQADEKIRWKVKAAESAEQDYTLALELPSGKRLPPALVVLPGEPVLYVTADTLYEAPAFAETVKRGAEKLVIPAAALETPVGVAMLEQARVELPARLAQRVQVRRPRLHAQGKLAEYVGIEIFELRISARWDNPAHTEDFGSMGWSDFTGDAEDEDETDPTGQSGQSGHTEPKPAEGKPIVHWDRTPLAAAPALVDGLGLRWSDMDCWSTRVTKKFPQQFGDWLQTLPPSLDLELDPMLATLREAPIAASVRLDVEPAGVDWFDLRVALDVPELEFTPEELEALLGARGGWVRLGAKGWKKLALQLTAEEDEALADLGLSAADLASPEPQRLHALQLGHQRASRLLPEERASELKLRVTELQARVSPDKPAAITAELRPYQLEGFHFLAYLSTNNFGGLLADDMGLGKTIQTLTWLCWLRTLPDYAGQKSLVVCPKSVMDNWSSEAKRFVAGDLRVRLWRSSDRGDVLEAIKECDLLVLNYAQLRSLSKKLAHVQWHAVILDEAQAIKNPDSQTAKAACALECTQRVALTGTPIENRLLDLWSIMNFAMPGVLGLRSRFAKTYDQKEDPLARRRLAGRVRPFVLRRTKEQVAKDLPARIEEDLLCEMEGKQATLYRAELKRARQALLKLKTDKELDKARFNILTSLLRLRQICCHPKLVDATSAEEPSAKVEALMEMLEPLLEEGRKVLVFSQFVGVLEILQAEIQKREWKHFILTGQTENRGALIADFQESEGAAVFLLSLKASGFGLNLTASSYVVLFDPWWNPAVENQAIDRAHRIGQKDTVFAYRLLVKGSIEEKIRALQTQKRALAADVLGEEAFAKALTLDDLRSLLEEPA
ncbi:MAG TPA: DEAD/DEAH box helicase [Chthoniobacteraceae bacterium]|nr:DEAD/DEAH box helicase [Chthoniobacteraceae bacterium]